MRKRSKGGRGSRSFASRARGGAGGGNSRVGKNVTETTNPSGGMANSRPTNNVGRRSKNSNNNNSSTNSQSSSNSIGDILKNNCNSSATEGFQFQPNGKTLFSNQQQNQSPSKVISSDFYLHKKFKKLTTTNSQNDNNISEDDVTASDVVGKNSKKHDNQLLSNTNGNVNINNNNNNKVDKSDLLSTVTKTSSSSSLSSSSRTFINSKDSISTIANTASNGSSSKSSGKNDTNSVSTTLHHSASSHSNQVISASSSSSIATTSSGLLLSSSEPTTNSSDSTTINNINTNDNVLPNYNLSTSSSSSCNVVYKPKFRISTPDDVSVVVGDSSSNSISVNTNTNTNTNHSTTTNYSTATTSNEKTSSTSSSTTSASVPVPGKISDLRMDRQSLDDRISKIIDENQSILSTWPEHLTKRLKSHVHHHQQQQQQQSGRTKVPNLAKRNSTTSMSGGSAEIPLNTGVKLRNLELSPLPIPAPLMRSQSDAGGYYITEPLNNIHNNSCSSSSSSSNNTDKSQQQQTYSFVTSSTNPTEPSDYSTGGGVNVVNLSVGSNTVVPKKRRRLSPTPYGLCGGEVSELPIHDTSMLTTKGTKGYFQDVDMTVRVSNCGTSGAKVTIRSTNSTNVLGSTGGGVINYNRLMDVPSSPLKLSPPSPANINCSTNLFIRSIAQSSSTPHHPAPSPSPASSITSSCSSSSLLNDKGLPEKDSVLTLNSSSILLDINKVANGGKGRGRPKKGKIVVVEPFQLTNNNLLNLIPPSPIIESESSSQLTVVVNTNNYNSNSNNVNGIQDQKLVLDSSQIKKLSSSTSLSTSPSSSSSSLLLHPSNKNCVNVDQESDTLKNDSEIVITKTSEISFISPQGTLKISGDISSNSPLVLQSSALNPKRPTFLALKPLNQAPKKPEHGVLPSPDTPRIAKPYNQMHINGNAYTYLGFKVSTRSSYTCLFRPQPMFLPQESDPKLSMYSNWQPRPRNKNQDDFTISLNDSRVNGRKSPRNVLYVEAGKGKCETETVNSPISQPPICSLIDPSHTSLTISTSNSNATNATSNSFNVSELNTSSSSTNTTLLTSNDTAISTTMINTTTKETPMPTSSPSSPNSYTKLSSNNNNSSTNSRPLSLIFGNSNASSSTSIPGVTNFKHKNLDNMGSNSGSDSSSADDSNNSFNVDKFSRGKQNERSNSMSDHRTNNSYMDGPLSLTTGSQSRHRRRELSTSNSHDDIDDEMSSSSVANRFDNPRVRIMEGGFESNEDYTYVRGRGRGRYVCEACGIRCKKPSMLRKHLKTHTDLRPYTCCLCNFSFKTKGNLTKHQKSKMHNKKCISSGIHPNSSRSLAMIGPGIGNSDTNTTDESEDEEDVGVYNGDSDSNPSQEDNEEDMELSIDPEPHTTTPTPIALKKEEPHSFEQEIAQSLLDLSKGARNPGTLGATDKRDGRSERYSPNTNQLRVSSSTSKLPNGFSPVIANAVLEESNSSSQLSSSTSEVPIDLSCKPNSGTKSSSSLNVPLEFENEHKRLRLEKNGYIRSFGVVGEAKRWEPEEEFMIQGCLNLKKIPNDSNNDSSSTIKKESTDGNKPQQLVVNGTILPVPIDVKPETRLFNFSNNSNSNNNNNNVGEKPYEFNFPKRKRDSSTSSCSESYAQVPVQLKSPVRSSSSSSLNLSSSSSSCQVPNSATNSAINNNSNNNNNNSSSHVSNKTPNPKQPKFPQLHQPWLSPRDSRSNLEKGHEVGLKQQTVQAISNVVVVEPRTKTPPPLPLLNGTFRDDSKAMDAASDIIRESNIIPNVVDQRGGGVQPPSPNTKVAFSGVIPIKPQSVASRITTEDGVEIGMKQQQVQPNNGIVVVEPLRQACEFRQPSGAQALVKDEGKAECNVCKKTFARASQLTLHMNIHYLERPFRCDPCAVSFRTKGHLIKHRRSSSHDLKNKVTYYVANEENPRPFKCPECKIAFRIHGHLAKHLRSKMHIMRLECLGKLPFGIYFEMEKSGLNLNEIDTTDCDMSLISMQSVAKKIYGDSWTERLCVPETV